jgi:hypothetical protein
MPDDYPCYPMRDRAIKPRPFPSASLRTSQDVSKYMVARLLVVYAGQCGRPLWFGFRLRAKFTQAVLSVTSILVNSSPQFSATACHLRDEGRGSDKGLKAMAKPVV